MCYLNFVVAWSLRLLTHYRWLQWKSGSQSENYSKHEGNEISHISQGLKLQPWTYILDFSSFRSESQTV